MGRLGVAAARVLAAFATVALFVPLQPGMPAVSLDPSWRFALNQAMAQHLSFGKELVFTFGPWASLFTQNYHPATDRMMLLGGLYLASSCWFACWTLTDRRTWPWMTLLASAFLTLRLARDAALFLPPVLAVLASLRLTAWREKDQHPDTWITVAAVGILFAPLGLLPLVKGSSLALSVGVAACAGAWYASDRKPVVAASVVIAPLVAAAAFWRIAGQTLATLPLYLARSNQFSSAFGDAMSVDGKAADIRFFLAGAVAVILTAVMNRTVPGRVRLYLIAVYGLMLFVAFKAAFIRHDFHALIGGSTLLFAALTLPFFGRPAAALPAMLLVFAAWAAIDTNYSNGWRQTLVIGASTVYSSFAARLSADADLPHEYAAALESIATQQPLPSMPGSSDIYPYDQANLFASRNVWSPRPVFQSYAAYTPEFAEANRQHLVGEDAPSNIVFRVAPIDNRVPASEDGPSWPALLRHYRPTAMDGDFLVLQHRKNDALAGETGPSVSSTHVMGERIPLPASERLRFARLEIQPTLLGNAIGFLFKRSHIVIRLELRSGLQREFRLVPGLAASGFVLSPLIETTPEFGLLYGRVPVLRAKEVTAFTVAPLGGEGQWAAPYRLVMTEINTSGVDEISSVMALPKFDDEAPGYQVEDAAHCDGSIDLINGVAPGDESLSFGFLQTAGWVIPSIEQGRLADTVYVVLTDEQGQRHFSKASSMSRPDVSAYFHKPGVDRSGFSLTADVSALQGRHSLGVAVTKGDRLEICPQPQKTVNISPR